MTTFILRKNGFSCELSCVSWEWIVSKQQFILKQFYKQDPNDCVAFMQKKFKDVKKGLKFGIADTLFFELKTTIRYN